MHRFCVSQPASDCQQDLTKSTSLRATMEVQLVELLLSSVLLLFLAPRDFLLLLFVAVCSRDSPPPSVDTEATPGAAILPKPHKNRFRNLVGNHVLVLVRSCSRLMICMSIASRAEDTPRMRSSNMRPSIKPWFGAPAFFPHLEVTFLVE
jgi:hypothetical protein